MIEGFEEVLGNEALCRNMKRMTTEGSLAHCYIVYGEKGVGKKHFVQQAVKALMCDVSPGNPCGACTSCFQMVADDHPDVIWVKREKTVFGVDDIRTGLNEPIRIRPYRSAKKVFILNEGELLNAQAQNAMLKTIEEPPEYAVIFILTTNREALLETVRSRAVELAVSPVTYEEEMRYLAKSHRLSREEAEAVWLFSRGNLGRAREYLENESYQNLVALVTEFLRSADEQDVAKIDAFVKNPLCGKENLPLLLELFRMWFRDVELWAAAGSEAKGQLLFASQEEAISRQASRYSGRKRQEIWEALLLMERSQKVNVNYEMSLMMLLVSFRA